MKNFFPIFQNHPELIFLDSAASVQKPQAVLDSIKKFSEHSYANIHRGMYSLSIASTEAFETARKRTARFLDVEENGVIFTKNGTEASNLFVRGFAENFLQEGDEVLVLLSEHHANMVPYLALSKRKKILVKFVYPNENGIFSEDAFENAISEKTKIFAFAHVSNVTGQIFPVQKWCEQARKKGIITVVDACQSIPHQKFSFKNLGPDAAFFTGHKLGAGGTGALLLTKNLQEQCEPLLFGGDSVEDVWETGFSLRSSPEKFESGTPPIENVVGLSAALDFLEEQGMEKIENNVHEMTAYALQEVQKKLPHWKLVGPKNATERGANVSVFHEKIHHLDVGFFLAENNIAVRTGFHCANPLHHFLKCSGTVRASFWMYTEKHEIDAFVSALERVEKIFS